MNTRMNALAYLFLVLCLSAYFASFAIATHEVGHRFTVYGYVKDLNGNPVRYKKVTAVDITNKSVPSEFDNTDGNGYYEIVLHLHDENLGDEIMVYTDLANRTLIALFDPNEHVTERKAPVDDLVEETRAPQNPSSSPIDSTTANLIFVSFIGMVIVGYLGYSKWKKRGKRSRLRKKGGKRKSTRAAYIRLKPKVNRQ